MNYGKYETERRIKSLHSKSGKYASRLFLNIFKALFVLFLFLAVVGASIRRYLKHSARPLCHHGL